MKSASGVPESILSLFVLAMANGVATPGLSAQEQTTAAISGQVLESASDRPLAEVHVSLSPGGLAAKTNASGRFMLEGIPFGLYEIRFQRIGYATRVDSMRVGQGSPVEIAVRLAPDAVPLDPIEVVARSGSLDRAGFYDRQRFGPQGTYFTAADIERYAPTELTDLLRRAPAVVILDGGPGRRMLRFNRQVGLDPGGFPGCEPAVFVDGILIQDQNSGKQRLLDFNRVIPSEVEAVELYVGTNVPIQYNRTPCGTVLIWTKRGG